MKEFRKLKKFKVLVGVPHNEIKNYCFDDFLSNVSNLTYNKGDYDILIADNSKDRKNKKKIMKAGIQSIYVNPKQKDIRQYIADSHEALRVAALRGNYDFMLHLESDIFPPLDIIEKLLSHQKQVVAAPYFIDFGSDSHLMAQKIESNGNLVRHTANVGKHDILMMDGKLKKVHSAGLGCCFPANTKILDGNRIIKNIEDVKIGDIVLNHIGEKDFVEKTLKRWYDGEMIIIKPKYFRKDISVTPEHPILIVKKELLKNKYNYYINKVEKIIPEFINAEDIKDGDFVCYPKYKSENKNKIKYINIYDLIEDKKFIKKEGDYIFSTNSHSSKTKVSITKISKKYKIDRRTISYSVYWHNNGVKKENCFISEKKKNEVVKILKKEGFDFNYSQIKLKNKIKLDTCFFEFYGYYIAEGSSTPQNSSLEFSFGSTEIEYANRIKYLTKKIFGLDCRIEKRKTGNVIRVVICSKILCDFMIKISGKGASNKQIHLLDELILSGNKNINYFLDAYINGDGCIRKEYTTMATVSEKLAHNLKELYLFLGKVPTISIKKPKGNEKINGRSIKTKDIYTLSIYKNQKSFTEDENYFYIPVKLSKTNLKGYVYNIQVKKENTYCLESFAVHNCLIHKSVLQKINFRHINGMESYPDSVFAADCSAQGINIFIDTSVICRHENMSWSNVTDNVDIYLKK